MKLNYLLILGVASILTLGSAGNFVVHQPAAHAQTATSKEMSDSSMSGMFVAAEHPTQGMVTIVTETGKRYLVFDRNFQTDEGPDLFVLLHRSATPSNSDYNEEDYVILGALQQVNGTQRYEIPDSVNLKEFNSAVIWCREFNATFGYAVIGGDRPTIGEMESNPCAGKPNPCAGTR